MPSDKETLIAMGFEPARIEWALKATKNSGLQPAMDHLINNSDNPVPPADQQGSSSMAVAADDDDDEDSEGLKAHVKKMGGAEGSENAQEAKSIKCSECGKIFRNSVTASFHAEKSGHQDFEESTEEIKPLTEEEKKAKLQELREKLAEKRAIQAKDDAKANKANEALRRKAGQDTSKIKEDMQLKEAQKEADRKKREKIEDAKARAAIKAQIEADKKERAEKIAREKAIRDGQAQPSIPASTLSSTPSSSVKSSDNPLTRLQVRLSVGGPPISKAFNSDQTLVDVAEWVASENLAYDVSTIKFASMFPRKTFTQAEMTKTLKENGLTPSANLMAS